MAFLFSKPAKINPSGKKSKKLLYDLDSSIQKETNSIIDVLKLSYIDEKRVFCFRSTGSKAKAYARIWSFPRIFQKALDLAPSYAIEIISERFDKLSEDERKKVIIHELLHIPKNFSGSLLPHKYGNTKIENEVTVLFEKYKSLSKI